MEFVLVLLALALACGIAFGIVVLVTGGDPGLTSIPDGAETLPSDRPLTENDVAGTTFDTGPRGYRTGQVDEALSRLAYDIGFKDELIKVLASEVTALRGGRTSDANALREVRRRALGEHAGEDRDAEDDTNETDDDTVVEAVDPETHEEPETGTAPPEKPNGDDRE